MVKMHFEKAYICNGGSGLQYPVYGCDAFRRLPIWFRSELDEQYAKTWRIEDLCFRVRDHSSESVFQALFSLSILIPETRPMEKRLVSCMAMGKELA